MNVSHVFALVGRSVLLCQVALGLCSLSSCSKQEAESLSELMKQKEVMASKLAEVRKQNSKLRMELQGVQSTLEQADDVMATLRQAAEESRALVTKMHDEFNRYRQDYKTEIRQSAPGMRFDKLLAGEAEYSQVVIKDVQDEVVTFTHAQGIARVPSQELSSDLQELFVLEVAYADQIEDEKFVLSPGEMGATNYQPYADGISLDVRRGSAASSLPGGPPAPPPNPLRVAVNSSPSSASTNQPTGSTYRPIGSNFQGSYYSPLRGKPVYSGGARVNSGGGGSSGSS